MKYVIMGRYKDRFEEKIDQTDQSRDYAEYLLNEYRLAFGSTWTLRIVEELIPQASASDE